MTLGPLRSGGDDLAGRRNPVEDRHPDVHEDHVDVAAQGQLDAGPPVGRLPDQPHVGLGVEDEL